MRSYRVRRTISSNGTNRTASSETKRKAVRVDAVRRGERIRTELRGRSVESRGLRSPARAHLYRPTLVLTNLTVPGRYGQRDGRPFNRSRLNNSLTATRTYETFT